MKQITFIINLLFVVFLQSILGQTPPSIQLNLQPGQTYSQAIAGTMQQLDANRIPYGVLYERVMGWAALPVWNSGDTTDFVHIKQAWWDLENSLATPANTLDALQNTVIASLKVDKIPLIAINFGFGYVDSLALEDGRIRIENNQLIDTGGESPYITKKVHLAALATEKIIVNTAYQLVTNSSYLLHNLSDETVTGYMVQNLTTGQTFNLPASGTTGITFAFIGKNWLKTTLKTNKGNYISCQSIDVAPSAAQTRSTSSTSIEPEDRLLTSTIAFKGYNETTATVSHADYHIYYHFKNGSKTESERILKKPIVMVDGFDPLDGRKYNAIYDTLLLYDNGTKKLGDELRLKGYDVVILNFPITGTKKGDNYTNVDIPEVSGFTNRDGGADYIERNAFLLVKLIQDLNAELKRNGSNEKLVVVGPSMGGQISRYALAYMEKKEAEGVSNMNHNTSLWISFDSPHLGANIPLAVQKDLYFFGFTGGQQAAKDAYRNQLNSIAARQMLIEQLNGYGIPSATDGQNGTAGYHQTYYAALKNNGLSGSSGWPTKLRKVALVNGNGSGVTTHQPSDLFLSLDAYKRLIFNIKVAEIKNRFMPSPGASNKLFEGTVTTTGFLSITISSEWNSVTNVNQRGSMDIVQGGMFNVQSTIKTQFSDGLRSAKVKNQSWSMMDNHCFIPTVSALGFKNPSFHWNATINTRDLVKTGEIPFDNYYIPSHNQDHVSLTKESVAWVMGQLNGNYYNQTGEFTISGPSTISGQATYTIHNLPPGATVQWSVSNTNLTQVSANGSSVVYRSDFYGESSIQATVSFNNTSINLTPFTVMADIDLGKLNNVYITGPSFVCGLTAEFSLKNLPDSSWVSWVICQKVFISCG